MLQCPICFQLLDAFTSVHCQTLHGLKKAEVIARYGNPTTVLEFATRLEGHVIHERDFTNYQLFDQRFRSIQRQFHVDRAQYR